MSDQQQIVVQARDHVDSLNAAICDVTIAHHSYWAWYYTDRISDEQVRAQIRAQLEAIAKQKG